MGLDFQSIRSSFEQVAPRASEFADEFYLNLFADYPAAKGLFSGVDMTQQKKNLVNSLVFIIENVGRPDKLIPYMRKMGERHVSYGVEAEHYEWVGYTLLKTLKSFLGESWSDRLKDNWLEVYQFLAETALEGANQASSSSQKVENEIAKAVKELAKNILVSAIDQSVADCTEMAKEKSAALLKAALEFEAKEIMGTFTKRVS